MFRITEPVFIDWMGISEVAEALGVSTETIRRWTAARRLPEPHRFSRRVLRWKRSDIEAFINAARSK